MKYKRPDPIASTESWVNIFLGCLDARFAEKKPTVKNTLNVSKRCTKHDPDFRVGDRHGTSLHQQECGHGYDGCRGRLTTLRHGQTVFIEQRDRTQLGSTPREYLDYIDKRGTHK